jgi:anaerobic selenocysteine-containing dehydrogenase
MTQKVTRRDFIKMGAAGLATAVLAGCQQPRRWVELEPYVRPPEEQLAGVATWFASTCRQCPAGCGILVRTMNGRAVKIEGNPEHPLNKGKLCARGQAGLQVLYNPDRLTGPVKQSKRGSREFEPIAWEAGINDLYTRLSAAGGRVAVWANSTASGHLVDLFQRFTAALGAPAPLIYDLYASATGHRALTDLSEELYGQALFPTYQLSRADVILSFGANLLGAGPSAVRYGIEFGAFRDQSLGKRGYLVHFEPRMTINAAVADHWIPIRPGTEGLVAMALIKIMAEEELGSAERAAQARLLASEVDVGSAALASDVAAEDLEHLAHVFAQAERPLAIPGGALAGKANGKDTLMAIQALNLLTGTAGEPGGMSLSLPSPSDNIVGPEPAAYADVENLLDRMRSGQVDVLLVHGANPIYEVPEATGIAEVLVNVPFVVSFAPIVDETAWWSDLILPDRTYLEGWGYTLASPGFDRPVVGSQQPVVAPVFDSRSTADILLSVAKGIPAAASLLPWQDEVMFLKETVGDLGTGASGGSGTEVLWARFLQHGGWWPATAPVIDPPAPLSQSPIEIQPSEFQGREQEFPYYLHLYLSDLLSDGRGASQTWLQGSPDPMTTVSWQTCVEIHPDTAHELGIKDGDIVQVTSPAGELEAPACLYPAIRPDTVAIPFGQGHTDYGRYARDRGSNPLRLVGSQTDASGKSLAWGSIRVRLRPTGERTGLALFENKEGVTDGFINMEFPH